MDLAIRGLLASLFSTGVGDFRSTVSIHGAGTTEARLTSFSRSFNELVQIMANAQSYGVSSGDQTRYTYLKAQLQDDYLGLRPFLLAYLRQDIEDEKIGLRTLGIRTDAFEAIWAHINLNSFVDSDDVFFRDRVARSIDAIRDYTEHLHCLLETRV